MRKAKTPRVPILENSFEVNLPKLMWAAKATGSSMLILDDGDIRTVAVLAESRIAVFLGGTHWVVDIVPVQCLQGRVRPLLKCPNAHEGKFQSLYYSRGELACRQCHGLRYQTTLCASAADRTRIARDRLQEKMGGALGSSIPARKPKAWRKKHARDTALLIVLSQTHYRSIQTYLARQSARRGDFDSSNLAQLQGEEKSDSSSS